MRPLSRIFALFFGFRFDGAAAVALSCTLLCIGTSDAFFTAFFCTDDIKNRSADYKHDNCDPNKINHIRRYTLRACSALICLFRLTIIAVKITTIESTIAQPRTGIQAAPKPPPVISVPKKNTRKPTVYPTAN